MRIDDQMTEIIDLIKRSNQIAISSDPGSGKSTRIPPALVRAGLKVLVLEPRRISAVSLATYISEQQNQAVGSLIGYQVRGDSKRSTQTKALFATEALLPKYLDRDPALSDWDVIILDEFHERHIHTDIAWALLNQIQRELRPDLKIVLLSATLNFQEIKKRWPDAQTLHISNPPHPLEIRYLDIARGKTDMYSIRPMLIDWLTSRAFDGDVLVFLPGYGDIERCRNDLLSSKKLAPHIKIFELYGSQSLVEQRLALEKSPQQKIILATNVAESSITIDGVRTVVDSGIERVAWANSKSGLTELKNERISKSSAIQRAGRAARQAAGTCYRLWSEAEQTTLDDFHLAEIHRSELSEALYAILACGWNPIDPNFVWFEKPLAQRIQDNLDRLRSLNLVDESFRINTKKNSVAQYPIGLRGSLYLESLREQGQDITDWDFAIAVWIATPDGKSPRDLVYQRDAEATARHLGKPKARFPLDTDKFTLNEAQTHALTQAIPDRLFERRSEGKPAVKLSCGRGAQLQISHSHANDKYGFALMLREADPDALISLWEPTTRTTYEKVVARRSTSKPVVHENFADAKLIKIQNLLVRAKIFQNHCDKTFDLQIIVEQAAQNLRESYPKKTWPELEADILSWTQGMCDQKSWARFEKSCPTHWVLPKSGRPCELLYVSDSRVELHARLQEFLGCKDHPHICEGAIPLTVVLLSPAKRPLQITQRLAEFWTGSYLEIKKEMKARYPKHDW